MYIFKSDFQIFVFRSLFCFLFTAIYFIISRENLVIVARGTQQNMCQIKLKWTKKRRRKLRTFCGLMYYRNWWSGCVCTMTNIDIFSLFIINFSLKKMKKEKNLMKLFISFLFLSLFRVHSQVQCCNKSNYLLFSSSYHYWCFICINGSSITFERSRDAWRIGWTAKSYTGSCKTSCCQNGRYIRYWYVQLIKMQTQKFEWHRKKNLNEN